MTVSRARRVRAASAGLALLLALTGCTGLPLSGPVTAGIAPGDAAEGPDPQFYAGAPTAGASPEEIVTGFVEAAISPQDSWETARLYLDGDLARDWQPQSGVFVDSADSREYRVVDDAVTVTIDPTATVDEHGTYTTSATGTVELPFRLAQREDGEWRIVEAPDGIVLDRQSFASIYSDHTLAYFDPTWTYLVPDVRWFPTSGNTATYIVRELVDGAPSPWLAGSVASAFSQDIDLAESSVPVDTDQVAHVQLNDVAAGADSTARGRMMAQLNASLTNSGVQSVSLTIENDETPLQANAVSVAQTRPDSRALVLRSGEFGFLSGSELTRIDGLSDTVEDMEGSIDSIAVSRDQQVAAVLQSSGRVHRLTSDGQTDHVDDEREGLIDPAIDPFGYIWTAAEDDPERLIAWAPELEPFAIQGAWGGASTITAMSMSRDGSRLAALVSSGGQDLAVVSSVRRDRTGKPTGLGEAMRVTQLTEPGIAVSWIEDGRIGIVSGDGSTTTVIEQQVGGPAERSTAPSGVVSIQFGTQDSSVRLLDDEGTVYMRRGSSWQATGADVSVIATQMGTPQTPSD
ncbi:LpqB family beta-propeller domain-containing protein [Microbacterium marinilacus]|uniref:MtrAB system accessory lipoprotein LpqB n=1 Tax=Microbacterium marinilacus TaxID=415209 RepID=A0ABP7BBI4_9MICO|nr:LpqB family beta-propeller domain-containing protein [Microbacterium marinilacus]MBY0687230.1 GerMN domain-containing protein [Microbacterium marinilacus]